MGMKAVYHRVYRGLTESPLALEPIHTALPGAETAMLKNSVGFFYPFKKFALFFQLIVGREPRLDISSLCVKRNGRKEEGAAQEDRPFDKITASDVHGTLQFVSAC
jgi:hypothetical protein